MSINDIKKENEQLKELVYLLKCCIDDYCPEIGMTVTVRQLFYTLINDMPIYLGEIKNKSHFCLWRYDKLEIYDKIKYDVLEKLNKGDPLNV